MRELSSSLVVKRGWLRGLDSNQDNQIQSLVCCRLHHPGAAAASAAILIDYMRFCDRFFFLLLADLPRVFPLLGR